MTTDWKALCAELLEDVRYLIDAVCDGEHDPVALQECAEDRDRARAALAQPEPEGLTDEEWQEFLSHCQSAQGMAENEGLEFPYSLRRKAEEFKARWGRPAIQPVPVSERLPGPEDCDEEGRCWWWDDDDDKWCLHEHSPRILCWTHWLPHHALPVPTS